MQFQLQILLFQSLQSEISSDLVERLQLSQAMTWEESMDVFILFKGLQGNCCFRGSLPKGKL